MILGILGIPLGIIISITGFFESLGSGDASMFGFGLGMAVTGTIMFIVGLILSIILKKSGDDKHIHISITSDEKGAVTLNPDSLLKQDEKSKEIPSQKSVKELAAPPQPIDKEQISFSDMLEDILEAGMGDTKRLEYIEKRVRDNRTIYDSDAQYVTKQFRKLRADLTKDDD